MAIIEVENLSRSFGSVVAVDDVSFDVQPGEIFGFLGPNGAGKSTTINMLCTLLKPTSGRAVIDGKDIAVSRDEVRKSIGLVFQDPMLDERLTARQNLNFHALLYDVSPGDFEARSRELLEMVDLADKMDRDVSTYSNGMKRRLEIAMGLLHHPKVLFLDEPTVGLDPQTRRHIWEYIEHMREAEGLTVFLTTHYMDETEICDRLAIIDYGNVVACDTPEELKNAVGADVVTMRTSDDAAAAASLTGRGLLAELADGRVRVHVDSGSAAIPDLVRLLDADGSASVLGVELRRPTMDDVFVGLTGKEIREERASDKDRMRAAVQQHGGH